MNIKKTLRRTEFKLILLIKNKRDSIYSHFIGKISLICAY